MPLGRESIHPLTLRAVLNASEAGRIDRSYIRTELSSDLEGVGFNKAAVKKNLETFDRLVKATKKESTVAAKKKKTTKRKNPGLAKGQSLMQRAAAEYNAGKHSSMQSALKAVAKKSR
jgi:hypothetical protein